MTTLYREIWAATHIDDETLYYFHGRTTFNSKNKYNFLSLPRPVLRHCFLYAERDNYFVFFSLMPKFYDELLYYTFVINFS